MLRFNRMFHTAIKAVLVLVTAIKPMPTPIQFGSLAGETHTATTYEYRLVNGDETFVAQSQTAIPLQPGTSVPFSVKGKHIYVVDYDGETHKLPYTH
jgi:hypothetical protein